MKLNIIIILLVIGVCLLKSCCTGKRFNGVYHCHSLPNFKLILYNGHISALSDTDCGPIPIAKFSVVEKGKLIQLDRFSSFPLFLEGVGTLKPLVEVENSESIDSLVIYLDSKLIRPLANEKLKNSFQIFVNIKSNNGAFDSDVINEDFKTNPIKLCVRGIDIDSIVELVILFPKESGFLNREFYIKGSPRVKGGDKVIFKVPQLDSCLAMLPYIDKDIILIKGKDSLIWGKEFFLKKKSFP